MDLAINIIIGNAISLIAGIFIILSMWVNDEKQAYKYQFWNAFILIISSVFFLSWTGVTTMAIAASRNAMVYYDRLTSYWTVFFIIIGKRTNKLVVFLHRHKRYTARCARCFLRNERGLNYNSLFRFTYKKYIVRLFFAFIEYRTDGRSR